jgi:hypothetical protein
MSKYFFQFWRPITGIRESDRDTGPTFLGGRQPYTTGDTACSPLGAPGSNLTGPNFTSPFPAYPSGHTGFGGELFQTEGGSWIQVLAGHRLDIRQAGPKHREALFGPSTGEDHWRTGRGQRADQAA